MYIEVKSNKTKMTSLLFFLTICFILSSFSRASVLLVNRDKETQHYSISVDGTKIGYRIVRAQHSDNICSTDTLEVIYANRDGQILSMVNKQSYKETPKGLPLSFEMTSKTSKQMISYRGVIKQGVLLLSTTQNNITIDKTFKWDYGTLFPQALSNYQRIKGYAKGTNYTTQQYFPSINLQEAILVKNTVIGPEKIKNMGIEIDTIKIKREISSLDSYSEYEWLDEQGLVIKSTAVVGGLEIKKNICSKEDAIAINLFKVPNPLDMTAVPVSQKLANRTDIKKITLSIPKGNGIIPPESAMQIVRDGGGVWIIELVGGNEPNEIIITLGKESTYRKPNIFLNWQDSKITDLKNEAISSNCNFWRKAKLLTHFVYNKISTKDLSVGLATSSEIATQLTGDCTEHAILLATMLRSVGLPSRVVCGLLYVDGSKKEDVWSFHMWTQVNINNKWYNLDSFLGQTEFKCDYIALSQSSLENSDIFLLSSSIIPVLKNGSLKIVSVEY